MTGVATERGGPYVGIRAFRRADSHLFFGRDLESREIATLWRANRLTVLYGASGVGKTSLLQAGVIPLFDPARVDVLPVGRPPLSSSFDDAGEGNPYTEALLSSWSAENSLPAPGSLTVSDFLRSRGGREDRYGDPIPVLAAVDQAEELFTDFSPVPADRAEFIEDLAEAVHHHQGLRLLLVLREEYLAAVLPYEDFLSRGSWTRFRLLPFHRDAALAAVRRPVESTHRFFADGAAEHLVDSLRTVKRSNVVGDERTVTVEAVEPVQLQVVCAALWDSLPPEVREITPRHVHEHADVDRFLANFCKRALDAVAGEHDIATAKIRSWLQQQLITEHGTRGTIYQGLHETAGMPNRVVRSLEDHHILKAEYRYGTCWYELQHDRLIEPIRMADPDENLQAARLALAENDWTLAGQRAGAAVRACGDGELRIRAEAEALLADAAAGRNAVEVAREHCGTAIELFGVMQDFTRVGRLLAMRGRLALELGRHAEAVQDLTAAANRIPDDLSVQTELGKALWRAGRLPVAVAILDGVLRIDGDNTDARRVRGEILADLGQAEEALRDLEQARRRQRPDTQAARALALATLGRFDAAGQEAADAIANGDTSGPVLLLTARVRALGGDHLGAIDQVNRALEAGDPSLSPHQRGQARRLLGQWATEAP